MAFVVVVVVVFVVVVAAIVVVGNIREKQATATAAAAAAGMFRSGGDGTKATARCFPGNSRRRGHNYLKCFAEGDFAKVAVVTARIAIQIQGRPQPQHQQQPQLSPNTPIIRFTRHLLLFPALFFVVG